MLTIHDVRRQGSFPLRDLDALGIPRELAESEGLLLGGKLTYRQALSIVSHTGLISLPAFAVMIPLALVSKTAQVSVGPGMLFNPMTAEGFAARFIAQFMASIDVFKIWQVALTALGVSVIGRVDRGKATVFMFVAYFVASLLGACVGAVIPIRT